MKRSFLFVPTLRENPVEAEISSHRFLLRAGFVRPSSSGVYSLLPLGLRVRRRIERIIREEMDSIGAQEFVLPSLQPAELWRESGRWNAIGTEMLRLRDRSNREMCLAMTHEELFTSLARELRSYRELPVIWYQIATKFRDEPRPRGGFIRLREFTMKDSYSFAIDESGLENAFRAHEEAYRRIFARCGLEVMVARADNGLMGGSDSREFVTALEVGEDWVAVSSAGEVANLEVAISRIDPIEDSDAETEVRAFDTPGIQTIEALEAFGVPATKQIKTLVMMAQGEPIVVLLRGDHSLNETKLAHVLGTSDLRPATLEETRELMGAGFGSLGPVGVRARIIADETLIGRRGMVSGANQDGVHLAGLEVGRDFQARFADVRQVKAGEQAVDGSGALEIRRVLELGHIFKLGTRYAKTMNATVQNAEGQSVPLVMGSYGIGVERLLAAIAEHHADERGFVWPRSVAPFDVIIVPLESMTSELGQAAQRLYEELRSRGVDVLLDDRDERPGVKLSEAELIGVPEIIVFGARSFGRGVVEVRDRSSGQVREVAASQLINMFV